MAEWHSDDDDSFDYYFDDMIILMMMMMILMMMIIILMHIMCICLKVFSLGALPASGGATGWERRK